MAADSVARGLALAALGQYNKLIKVKGFTITGTEDEWGPDLHKDPAITEKEKVRLKVNYEYWETETGPKTSSYFKIEQGRGIHYYGLNIGDRVPNTPTTAHQGQYKDEHGNWLGYDATQYYYIVQYIDGSYREFEVPILSPSFKKIILDWATHHGILPDPATAEDNAIYFLEQEPKPGKTEGTYLLYVRTLDKSKTPHQWQWTNIGSTEFDLSEYQKKIDTLIKFKTTNYDPATKGAKPVIENVVGSANQALASIGPIITGDTYTLYKANWRNEVTETVSLPTGLWVEPVAPATEYTIKLSTRLDPTTTPTTTIPGVTVARTGVNEVTFSTATKPTTELTGTLTYGVSDTVQTIPLSEYTSDIRLDDSRFSIAWNSKDVKEFIVKLNDPTQVPTTDVICGSTQLHIDFSKDISDLGLRTQILKTLDPTFTKRSDIITALNEHERELMFVYDYATAKINTTASGLHGYIYDGNPERKTEQTEPLANHSGHNKDVRSILKSIGDMANLKYIPYTIDSDPTKRNPYCDYTIPASPKPITGHEIDAICWELDNYKWTLVDAINAAKTRYDADLRATANVNQYSTYDIKGENELYDKEKEDRDHPAETKNETFTVKRDEIVCRKRKRKSGATGEEIGIYEITYNLGHTYIESKGDFTFTQTVSTTVPVTIIGLSESIVKFQIGDDTTPYVLPPTTTELGTITVTYTGQDQDRYGRIDIPAIKIRKESEIDHDEVKGEDDQHGIQKSGWYYYEETYGDPPVVHKGLIYYVELKYSAVGKDDGTGKQHEVIDPDYPITYEWCPDPTAATPTWKAGLPDNVNAIWNPQAKDYDQGVGKNVVILVYKQGETPIPTVGPDYFALRVNYWKPSNTSSRYYLEYEGHPYSFALSGDKIEIEKDKFLKDVSVKTCEVKDKPIPGLNVGDKYLDFEFWLEDGTTKHAYIICKDLGIPIIDTTALPTQNIQENFFYRTRDISEVVERYALKDQAIIDGYKLTHNGLYIPGTTPQTIPLTDPTLPNYIDPDPTAPDPTKPIEIDTHGPLSKVSDGKATPTYTYKFDYNQSPVTLQFHDEKSEENHKWVDMISKYKVVNTFVQDDTTTPWTLVKGDAWQLYVLLTEDHGYEPGIYIWDINDYRAISSESEAILDVTTLPVAPMIEENVFYRTHNTDTILKRYNLKDGHRRDGWVLTPEGVHDPAGTNTPWDSVDVSQDQFHACDDGPIYRVKLADGSETTIFNYHRTKTDIQFHDKPNDRWIDVIPTYKVVSKLPTKGEEYQIYFVLNEMFDDGGPGTYVWTESPVAAQGGVWTQVDCPAIRELSGWTKTREGEFYSYHIDTEIIMRYKITDFGKTKGYSCDFTGLYSGGTKIHSWDEITPAMITQYMVDGIMDEDANHGEIFKITNNPTATTPTYEFKYKFKTSELGLKYYDFYTNKWVNLVSKYVAVNTFTNTDGTFIPGDSNNHLQRDWEIYVLLNDTPNYKKGVYIWDRKDYISITGDTDAIIDVDNLPTLEIEDNKFYRTKTKSTTIARYDLTDDQKNSGAYLTYDSICLVDSTTSIETKTYSNTDVDALLAEAIPRIKTSANGPISKISNDSGATYHYEYKFINPKNALEYHTDNYWTNVIAKNKVVTSLPTAGQSTTENYVLLEDWVDMSSGTPPFPKYTAGEYVWDGAAWQRIATNTEKPILNEKPIIRIDNTNPLNEYFFREYDYHKVVNIYSLTPEAIQLGWTTGEKGLTDPDGYIILWKDVRTDVHPLMVNNKGDIFVVEYGPMGTEFVYNYNSSPIKLEFWDKTKKEYVEVISKFEGVTHFIEDYTQTPPTLIEGRQWQLYILLNDETDPTTKNILYRRGIYIWNGKDYVRADSSVRPIIDVETLPLSAIENDCFYRTRNNNYSIVGRYRLSDTAVSNGYQNDLDGIVDPTIIPPEIPLVKWDTINTKWNEWTTKQGAETEPRIVPDENGIIYRLSDGGSLTKVVYDYSDSSVTLQFYDEWLQTWIDVSAKYIMVNTFTHTDSAHTLINNSEDLRYMNDWQIYVLTNDTPTYTKGTYVWNKFKNDYISIDSNAIIDVETLPTTNIENNRLYRTKGKDSIIGKYDIFEGLKEKNYLTPEGYWRVESDVYKFYKYEDITTTIFNTDFTKSSNGPLIKVKNGTTETLKYKFVGVDESLQYHTDNHWTDIISNYKVVTSLPTEGKKSEKYILLEDWKDPITYKKYIAGEYIWDMGEADASITSDLKGTWYRTSTNNERPILNSKPYDCEIKEKNYLSEHFFRSKGEFSITDIYGLRIQAIENGYFTEIYGLGKPDGSVITWNEVYSNFNNYFSDTDIDKPICHNSKGDIFELLSPKSTKHLEYNYNSSPIKLEFWDETKKEYVEVISKFEGVTHFIEDYTQTPPTLVEGRQWQLYILLNDETDPTTKNILYRRGIYIWNGKDYVRADSSVRPIIDVETLPNGNAIEEDCFYRTHDDTIIRTRYKLSDGAIAEGYKLFPEGIKKGIGTSATYTNWSDVYTDFNKWINKEAGKDYARIEQDLIHGPIYLINPFPAIPAAKSLVYNYHASATSLQFHNTYTDYTGTGIKVSEWVEMISKYETVNTFYNTDGTLKPGKEWQIYMLLNDDIDPDTEEVLYKRGIYIWDRASETAPEKGDYIAVSSITDCIIVVDTLPTLNINSKAIYELRTDNTLPTITNYKIKSTEPTTTTLDIYGLHYQDTSVTPPVDETVCFADLFLGWEDTPGTPPIPGYNRFFEEDTATPTTGKIWKIVNGTETEFRWSDTKPELVPEKRTQFYIYNEDTSEWKLLADDNNSINGVYDHNKGRQTSESLEIIWEGSKTDYEALTKINPSTLYLVHNGEGKGPTISYNTLDDRPKINHVLLQGDTTLQELGITAFVYKGSVPTESGLPTADQEQGDLYYIEDTKELKAWNGIKWDLAGTSLVDMSKYQTREDSALKTTDKTVVGAINWLYENSPVPVPLEISWAGSASIVRAMSKAWYTGASKEIRFNIALSGINITEDKQQFKLGTVTFTDTASGTVITPEYNQALASCDLSGHTSTEVYINGSGELICNVYMGYHTLNSATYPNSYYTENPSLNSISVSGTIFCN